MCYHLFNFLSNTQCGITHTNTSTFKEKQQWERDGSRQQRLMKRRRYSICKVQACCWSCCLKKQTGNNYNYLLLCLDLVIWELILEQETLGSEVSIFQDESSHFVYLVYQSFSGLMHTCKKAVHSFRFIKYSESKMPPYFWAAWCHNYLFSFLFGSNNSLYLSNWQRNRTCNKFILCFKSSVNYR